MDSRTKADLDNYITGHYGEDQFIEPETCTICQIQASLCCDFCGDPFCYEHAVKSWDDTVTCVNCKDADAEESEDEQR